MKGNTMTEQTYENRSLSPHIVKKNDVSTDGKFTTILTEESTGFGIKTEIGALLPVGKEFVLETKNFSQITGFLIDDVWHGRKSDQDLADELEQFRADRLIKQEAEWAEHHEDWQEREDALPDWLRERFATFHEKGGHNFEIDGWGYELIVGELAAMFSNTPPEHWEDDAALNEYAKKNGISGNQWGFGKMLATAHANDPTESMAETPGALTPISGDPFYEGKS
jgi:hypothetical protein